MQAVGPRRPRGVDAPRRGVSRGGRQDREPRTRSEARCPWSGSRHRAGRDGRGLPCPRYQARPGRRAEGAAGSIHSRPGPVGAVRARGEGTGLADHSSIGTIHGLEESEGVKALVLELVEGPTPAELIERRPTEAGSRKPDGWPAPGRIQVEADAAFVSKSGAGRGRVAGQPMGPEVSFAPVLPPPCRPPRFGEGLDPARVSASCHPAAVGAWRPVLGRVRVRSTSTAHVPGTGSSSPPRRAPGSGGATWRWSGERRRAWWPRPVQKRPRRGATRSWRAEQTRPTRRASVRSLRAHRVGRWSDESAVLQMAYTQKTTA